MTNQKPIEPLLSRELVNKWCHEAEDEAVTPQRWFDVACTKAAQWGFNQRGAANEAELQKARDEELEACCALADERLHDGTSLRAARRPKPPSQAEEALILLNDASDRLDAPHENGIRRALERLRELEGNQ